MSNTASPPHRDRSPVREFQSRIRIWLTNQEVATALDISDATVEREWTISRAWLIREMATGRPGFQGRDKGYFAR